MTCWQRGASEIEQQLASGDLQKVTGSQTNGARLLEKAERTVQTAAGIVATDSASAYVLAYDAARHACTALLSQQGLRPTSRGGHYAVDLAVRSQFGTGFRAFGTMRRRRNELEYPRMAEEEADEAEAQGAVDDARALIAAAAQLLPKLSFF